MGGRRTRTARGPARHLPGGIGNLGRRGSAPSGSPTTGPVGGHAASVTGPCSDSSGCRERASSATKVLEHASAPSAGTAQPVLWQCASHGPRAGHFDPSRVRTIEDPPSVENGSRRRSLSRTEKALALVDRDGLGLEIGPSHNPIAPRRAGFKVEILDYMNADALREKFGMLGLDVESIEEVDFVWSGEPIPELVGGSDRYDWIIASHVIEHLPDLLGFLHDCGEVLRPQGVVSLVIPDKRYCFDHFRALSTTGEVLDAFEQRRIRPTPGSVFDNMVNCVTLDDQGSWSVDSRDGTFRNVYSFEEARKSWDRAKEGYEDAHVWRFTPASFRLILEDLTSLGLMSFDIIEEFDTAGNEFFVTLGRTGAHRPAGARLALLQEIERELVEATLVETTAVRTPSGDAAALALSPKEEKMIAFKRRVMEATRQFLERRPR